ncbi:MAG TPA: hypothetical protein VMB72_13475 [Acidimicrobiales bacterium]|nr:hypothetical protein [Acidimicrobiales bacterium]
MDQGGILRDVEEKLYRSAAGGVLAQAAVVQRSFLGGLTQDRVLRWTGWACGVVSESLTMLAGEIDQLRDQLARFESH